MVDFIIGDLLTGKRIQTVPVLSGSWSDKLNDPGSISCTVTLTDPDVRRLGLGESAAPDKAFLAALDGSNVLAAGPIWNHQWDEDSKHLTITAQGMWSYFDHRVLLPVLAGRLPTDVTTDTRYWPVDATTTPPWVSDTTKSLQGIALAIVTQALTFPNGNVPIVLPSEIAGNQQRWYKGTDLAFVGARLRELTAVAGGPDIAFAPRMTSDMLGVEWVMKIGTPTQPQLFSPQQVVFNVSTAGSSVSNLSITTDGSSMGSTAYASGGATADAALTSVSTDPTLTGLGYPLLDNVDSSHSSVSLAATLQGYTDEIVLAGKTPVKTWAFDHNVQQAPFLSSFLVGDFAKVRVKGDPYIADNEYTLRVTSRSGDEQGRKVSLTFQPMVGA